MYSHWAKGLKKQSIIYNNLMGLILLAPFICPSLQSSLPFLVFIHPSDPTSTWDKQLFYLFSYRKQKKTPKLHVDWLFISHRNLHKTALFLHTPKEKNGKKCQDPLVRHSHGATASTLRSDSENQIWGKEKSGKITPRSAQLLLA